MSSYTVGQLAKLSGVSVATLHHYDKKGLLRPVHKDQVSRYRFYGENELLRLQQILFYKELGFSLVQIKKILNQKGFALLTSLQAQRKMFLEKIDLSKKLVKTIDLTMQHLEESIKMEDKQFFDNFFVQSDAKNAEYQMFMYGKVDPEIIKESNERCKDWSSEKGEKIKEGFFQNGKKMVQAIEQGLSYDSKEVQAITKEHYQLMSNFWTYDKDAYIKAAKLYQEHPDFVAFYKKIHPKLGDFLANSMIYWANKNL